MADNKISALAELTSIATDDEFVVVDKSDTAMAGSGTSKKITQTNLGIPVKATGAEIDSGSDDAKFATAKAIKDSKNVPSVAPSTSGNVLTSDGTDWTSAAAAGSSILTVAHYAPEGFLINGLIVPSVATDDLTVAIKGMDGNDPSAGNPVYCRIGGTVRTIVAALSVTLADGTNWFNAGSAELATVEIDYFVYLGYNATDGVVIGASRYPGASSYDDFSATTTGEKYCAISDITTAAAADYYNVIGRFAATLSAGAGYTWTVPTFTAKNLIQRPIYETRWLTWSPTAVGWTSYSSLWAFYKVKPDEMMINYSATTSTSNSTSTTTTVPFSILNYQSGASGSAVNNTVAVGPAKWAGSPGSATITWYLNFANAAWSASGTKGVSFQNTLRI